MGIIINPAAGLGGPLGRKGSDEPDLPALAAKLGRVSLSATRAVRALNAFRAEFTSVSGQPDRILCGPCLPDTYAETDPHDVGAPYLDRLIPKILHHTAEDTQAVTALMQDRVDLILFAGGDGTARDICAANSGDTPILGIPSGVKMHSGVFARSPERAGQMAARFLGDPARRTETVEILDLDEAARRRGRLSARLYSVARTPLDSHGGRQNPKAGGTDPVGEMDAALAAYARGMRDDTLYILGPGATMAALKDRLGGGTLLGVDLALGGAMIARDVDEDTLLARITGRAVRVVLTVVGGQGFVLGRGNQQISARVLRAAGTPPIDVICGAGKLAALSPQELTIDTGDPVLDDTLAGYWPVMTGPGRRQVMKVVA